MLSFFKSLLDAFVSYAGPILNWIKSKQDKQDQFFKDIQQENQSRSYDALRASLEEKVSKELAEEAIKMRESEEKKS